LFSCFFKNAHNLASLGADTKSCALSRCHDEIGLRRRGENSEALRDCALQLAQRLAEEGGERASLDEDEHPRNGYIHNKMATSTTTKLTHLIRLARFIRFALASLKMRLASLGSAH